MSPDGPGPSARAIAAAVRDRGTSASAVLKEHLAGVADREPEVHAFNLVMEERARAQAAEVNQQASRPARTRGRSPGYR